MTQRGQDDNITVWLKQHGHEVTRENWLAVAYPLGLPEPWTDELEEQLPPDLQRGRLH